MTLYILAYNNYYNRILKYEGTVGDYQPYVKHTLTNTNFNPGDGVNTKHVFGSNANSYNGMGDYVIAVDDQGRVASRWFILEANRNRAGQWTLDLYRDLLADYNTYLYNLPMFVEKGLPTINDPAIFNKEDMTFNQIKKGEYLVKDKTRCKWIAMYLDKSFPNAGETLSFANTNKLNVTVTGDSGHLIYQNAIGTDNYLYTDPHNRLVRYIINCRVPYGQGKADGYIEFQMNVNTNQQIIKYTDRPESDYAIADLGDLSYSNAYGFSDTFAESKGQFANNLDLIYADLYDGDTIDNYINGVLFLNSSTGKVFHVQAVKMKEETIGRDVLRLSGPAWDDYLRTTQALLDYRGGGTLLTDCPYASTEVTFDAYQFQITPVESEITLTTTIPELRTHTIDASYDLVVMPYLEEAIVTNHGWAINGTTSMFIAQQMAQRYGSGADKHIYDIQLLPFCPIPTIVRNSSYRSFSIDTGLTENKDFVYIKDGGDTIRSVMYFVPNCQVSYRGNLCPSFEDPTFATPWGDSATPLRRKVNLETKKFRLSSGDYSSSFEFNPFMFSANGISNVLNLDIAYKPYSPYIRLAPQFEGLYGSEFNDGRGLICTGDFSISSITDPFETYKLQNINYQRAFDRQIENLEVQQKYERVVDIVGAISGTFTGAAGGAIAGGVGGPVGAIAGAVVGAGASVAGGIADIALKDKLRNEAIDYAQDQFGYQMGNIKALPNTLNKVDSFNPNNKIWPVIEYYTCTDEEKQAFIDKLKYNGCTIMRIGTLYEFEKANSYDFPYTYFKAKLIRIDGFEWFEEDYHVLNQLSAELNKGIFI